MSKIKMSLFVPIVYHLALVIAMCTLPGKSTMGVTVMELMFGIVVTPMFFAVLSMCHAILHDGKVYDYIYYCLGFLGIIGLIRVVAYVIFGSMAGFLFALGLWVVSIGVYALWATLFALTDRMMKKRPAHKSAKAPKKKN